MCPTVFPLMPHSIAVPAVLVMPVVSVVLISRVPCVVPVGSLPGGGWFSASPPLLLFLRCNAPLPPFTLTLLHAHYKPQAPAPGVPEVLLTLGDAEGRLAGLAVVPGVSPSWSTVDVVAVPPEWNALTLPALYARAFAVGEPAEDGACCALACPPSSHPFSLSRYLQCVPLSTQPLLCVALPLPPHRTAQMALAAFSRVLGRPVSQQCTM